MPDVDDDSTPLEDVIERGKRLIAEAKATIADLDALNNTAVLPVLSFDDDPPTH